MANTYTIVNSLPPCDFRTIIGSMCHGAPEHPARFDGATRNGGTWAFMCEDAFRLHGVGVGTGIGQALILSHETPPPRYTPLHPPLGGNVNSYGPPPEQDEEMPRGI